MFKFKYFYSLILTFAIGGLIFVAPVNQVHAQEIIPNYLTNIVINKDGSVNVSEEITYDFGSTEHHGITRNIPYKYKARGGNYKLRISNITVTDDKGIAVPFTKSTGGGEIQLKIGDPETFVTGQHIYKLSYTVRRAINFFGDHDEFYWNAIGQSSEVGVTKAQVTVTAPAQMNPVVCYTGAAASTEQNCSIVGGNTNTATITLTKPLSAKEGITVVAGMPVGSIDKPTTAQKLKDIILDNGILVLPLLVLIGMYYIWQRFGKDAKRKNAIVAQYEAPDNLSAMYVGALMHSSVANKDIAAEVIYLATQGYLKIEQLDTKALLVFNSHDYKFTKLTKPTEGLAPQTRALLNKIFASGKNEVLLSELKGDKDFGTALAGIKHSVMKNLVADGYYRANPVVVKSAWLAGAFIGGAALTGFLGSSIGYIGGIAGAASWIILLIFAYLMPARTQKGADTLAKIYGLEDYMSVAEKDRMAFHDAPEKKPEQFSILLPFAIALGVEAAWAAQFKGLTQAPSWYTSTSSQAFNAMAFTNSLSNFSGSMQSAASSASSASSGGSGFSGGSSGGGFGGGSVGSW